MFLFLEIKCKFSISPGSFRKNPPQSPFPKGKAVGIPFLIEKLLFLVLLQFSWRRGSKDSRGQGFPVKVNGIFDKLFVF